MAKNPIPFPPPDVPDVPKLPDTPTPDFPPPNYPGDLPPPNVPTPDVPSPDFPPPNYPGDLPPPQVPSSDFPPPNYPGDLPPPQVPSSDFPPPNYPRDLPPPNYPGDLPPPKGPDYVPGPDGVDENIGDGVTSGPGMPSPPPTIPSVPPAAVPLDQGVVTTEGISPIPSAGTLASSVWGSIMPFSLSDADRIKGNITDGYSDAFRGDFKGVLENYGSILENGSVQGGVGYADMALDVYLLKAVKGLSTKAALKSVALYTIIGSLSFIAGDFLGNVIGHQVWPALGMKNVTMASYYPAHVGDEVAHRNKGWGMLGMIAGLAVGAAIVVVVSVATSGVGTAAAIAIICASGGLGAGLGGSAESYGSRTGEILDGSPDVFVGPAGKGVARKGDPISCDYINPLKKAATAGVFGIAGKLATATGLVNMDPHGPHRIAEACDSVFANGKPIARLGHRTECDGHLNQTDVSCITVGVSGGNDPNPLDVHESPWLTAQRAVGPGIAFVSLLFNLKDAAGIRAMTQQGIPVAPSNAVPNPDFPTSSVDDAAEDALDMNPTETPGNSVDDNLAQNRAPDQVTPTGEPIDIATGEFIDGREDIHIPGTIPLILARRYSSFSPHSGSFGAKWTDNWAMKLRFEGREDIYAQLPDGRVLRYFAPNQEIHATNAQASRYTMRGSKNLPISIFDYQTGLTYEFARRIFDTVYLSKIYDRNGNFINFYHNDDGLRKIHHSDGYALDIESKHGKIYRISGLSEGLDGSDLLRVTYDENGYAASFDSIQSGKLHYSYNQRGVLTSWRDAGKTEVEFVLDSKDRVVATKTAQGYFNDRFEYYPEEQYSVYLENGIHRNVYHYNKRKLVVSHTRPDGVTIKTKWNAHGQRIRSYVGNGIYANLKYNVHGSITRVEYDDGRKISNEYDDRNRIVERTNEKGLVQKYIYDNRDNLLAYEDARGLVTNYLYDLKGNLVRLERPLDGAKITYRYDAHNRVREIVDFDGVTTKLKIDLLGRVKSVTNAEGALTSLDYSPGVDNPRCGLREINYANQSKRTFERDEDNHLKTQIDALGQKTCYEYDAFDLLTKVTRPDGTSVEMRYDSSIRLAEITNSNGEKYSFKYDSIGRIIGESDFLGRTKRFSYDKNDRLERVLMPNGTVHKFEYGKNSQLNKEEIFVPLVPQPHEDEHYKCVEIVQYFYDDQSRLRAMKSDTCKIEFEYDYIGRITAEIVNGKKIKHNFDEETGRYFGFQTEKSSLKTTLSMGGKLQSMAINDHGTIEFSHNQVGREISRRSNSGFALLQKWGQQGELISQQAGSLLEDPLEASLQTIKAEAEREYSYDALMRVTQINDKIWGQSTYGYDIMGQISQATYGEAHQPDCIASETLQYDSNSNLIKSRQWVAGEISANLDETQFSSIEIDCKRGIAGRIERVGDTTYAYDEHGRLKSKRVTPKGFRPETWHFEWNHRDQLVKASNDKGEAWEYAYDLYGRRLSKTCAAGKKAGYQENFQWLGDRLIETVKVANGEAVAIQYFYKPGQMVPVAQVVDGELQYIVTDHNGTPTELFTELGELLWSRKGRIYGQDYGVRHLRAANDNGSYSDCLIRFQGQYYDQETGLCYNRFRYYDPEVADYITPDPIGIRGGLRSFGYVTDPLSMVDPLGLRCPTATYSLSPSDAANKLPNEVADISNVKIDDNNPYILHDVPITTGDPSNGFTSLGDQTVDLNPILNDISSNPNGNHRANFNNNEGILPSSNGPYTEYRVPPTANGSNRGRIVVGNDGTKYYSPDHYNNFIELD